jgi:ribonuclease Z
MHIYAQPDLQKLLQPLLDYHANDRLYEIIFHPINPRKHTVIFEDRTVSVSTIPLKHKVPCCGFLFTEKHRRADGNGGVYVESRRRYAYCSDTMYTEKILPLIEGTDTLFHEATYTEQYADKCKLTMHSTARQAAEIAKKAAVGQLIIGHYSARVDDHGLFLQEAREVFPDTLMAEERQQYQI